MSVRVIDGDVMAVLPTLDAESVQTCVTSPPYWGLRDYGVEGQLGLERTPEEYVEKMVAVFREVRRVLRDDGTLWLNLGDSYAGARGGEQGAGGQMADRSVAAARCRVREQTRVAPGLKSKDLVGIPWRVAFALQADGWYLRSDIIWHKPNPMPESVTDRPTKAHEYLFLLTKSERYVYDAEAIREAGAGRGGEPSYHRPDDPRYEQAPHPRWLHQMETGRVWGDSSGRNRRTVWTVATTPYSGAHFATFPPKLIEPCILAGSRRGDTVLDPFGGAGTTGLVADRLGRDAVLVELNPTYAAMARDRIASDAPLFHDSEPAA